MKTEEQPSNTLPLHHGQRSRWNRRAKNWENKGSDGLTAVVAAVLDAASCTSSSDVVDLGTGTGQLAIPIAAIARRVWAVDISSEMLERLKARARREGVPNVMPIEGSIESIDFPPASLDLVVSNYTLHHLRDEDKQRLIERAATWLRPGGKIVIGDMMFGRGSDARDRAIIAHKVATLARRGPAGWWRIAKNMGRFSLRIHERPVTVSTWTGYLEKSGFVDIMPHPVVAEAVVLVGAKPPVG